MRPVALPPFSTFDFLRDLREHNVRVWLDERGEPRAKFSDECPLTPSLLETMKERRGEMIALLEQERAAATPLPLGDARTLIDAVRLAGASIALTPEGKVRVTGADQLSADTIERLKANRAAVVRILGQEQP